MTALEAQVRLRETVAGLEEIEAWLSALLESVPDSPLELDSLLDSDDLDVHRELRSVVSCVLEECIRSAIRDLRDAAVYPWMWEEAEQRQREEATVLSPPGRGVIIHH